MGDTYTRQSAAAIATGNVITASDLEDEFDQVLAAFNSSTGHVHDGTDAPRISTIGPGGQYTGTATDFKPTSSGLDLGASASQWDNAYIDGIAYIDTATIGENEYVTITDNEYDVSSGNLTVDVAGNIILDADGGNVTLQDSGVTFANLNNATGELVIQSGSVPTTAVTFSGANADFAGTVDVTGAVTLDSTLGVTGAVTLDSTLDVTGAITGNLTGNADTASALASSVTIGGVSFDGSTNIDLPGVNTAGTQDTSGNAATSSAWAAGIEIALTGDVTGTVTGVDGSGNVSIATTVSSSESLDIQYDNLGTLETKGTISGEASKLSITSPTGEDIDIRSSETVYLAANGGSLTLFSTMVDGYISMGAPYTRFTHSSSGEGFRFYESGQATPRHGLIRWDGTYLNIGRNDGFLPYESSNSFPLIVADDWIKTPYIKKDIKSNVATVSTTLTAEYEYHDVRPGGNLQIGLPTVDTDGTTLKVSVRGSNTVTWDNTNISWDSGSTPSYTGSSTTADIYEFIAVGGSKWYGRKIISNAAI